MEKRAWVSLADGLIKTGWGMRKAPRGCLPEVRRVQPCLENYSNIKIYYHLKHFSLRYFRKKYLPTLFLDFSFNLYDNYNKSRKENV